MNQIICPKCGEKFTIDESSYAQIVNQIRNEEFENELKTREKTLEEKAQMQIRLLREKLESEKGTVISDKDRIIAELKHSNELLESEYKSKLSEELARKDEISRNKDAESSSLILKLEDEIKQLKMNLTIADKEKESALKEAETAKAREVSEALKESEIKIAELENTIRMNAEKAKAELMSVQNASQNEKNVLLEQIKSKETEKELAVSRAIAEIRDEKEAELAEVNKKYELLKVESESKLAAKDAELSQNRNWLSTIRILRQRCLPR